MQDTYVVRPRFIRNRKSSDVPVPAAGDTRSSGACGEAKARLDDEGP